MVGFTDLGDSRKHSTEEAASHALQFYARSILSNFSRPIAFYCTHKTTAADLTSMFWEIVDSLITCNFEVVALVADGAPINRKMFCMLNNMNLDVPYKCINIFKADSPIFLISDPPHLIKTACNNVKSSRPNGTRLLKYNNHFILWEHFCRVPSLYKSVELRCCKLTDAHFSHKSYAKMRVCLAAQLLSGTVAKLMKRRGGNEMTRSAWFADLFNKWFDIMNTRLSAGYNPDLQPFRTLDDPRLTWLIEIFLKELENWKKSLRGTPSEQAKQFLSQSTYEGLIISTKAMVELVQFLLKRCPPESYVLTKRINQDPLESYFGQMRQLGKRNEMPDLNQYAQFENIIVTKKKIKALKGSNVKHSINWKTGPVSNESMAKRKKPN